MDTTEMIENKIKKAKNWDDMKEIIDALPKTTFTVRIDELREKHNKRIGELQTETGISKSMIYAIFNGTRNPSKKQIIQIAFCMKLSVEELNELLKLAHLKELYAKNKEDAIIIFGIKRGLNLLEIDELLKDNNCKLRFNEVGDKYAE